ncbi:MAG: alanine--tRNA ligase [Candidatus Buchananbacteria bacterium CG10_big_fil_rev_8_21_14_0_10_42_9]|uniref:Alanine--tRNA ligase n=1 Tax=Candidatus Buchananbacteria bacterium CG10_big_fil_rev_8_21_14_0_10_42_9 TaxID=1974526 RepID=A0A2H0W3E2_9BACT|nr:MAG: alanine--tRNA ligase [Candidatus Buchananbacteria bacterium CG10_big_fil_rev_8_21_14_0_10_42_9]
MPVDNLREKFLKFFKEKGHTIIKSAPLIPENDPTVLFTTAGMHPLVPYLMGADHPGGKRVADVQKCIRTTDIDEVGDESHLTFFEMLGNWSFGDYFKKEAIEWSWEFLTDKKWLGLDPSRIYVSVFAGDNDAPRDNESIAIWQEQFKKAGIDAKVDKRIFTLGKKDNWWGPAGETGPCGPDTEMFYDTGKKPKEPESPKDFTDNPRYVEIWNDVFMQYNKAASGKFEPLDQKNVDTGMGLERTVAVLGGYNNVYETEFFRPAIKLIEDMSGLQYGKEFSAGESTSRSMRIITDHIKSATFILGDEKGVSPSNLDQGYILRRLIRRAIREAKKLGINRFFTTEIAEFFIAEYSPTYPELAQNKEFIITELMKEEENFNKTLERGLKEFEKMSTDKKIDGREAFVLFATYGFPYEMTEELAKEKGLKINKEEFDAEFAKHQDESRKGLTQKFHGGLADQSEATAKMHTANHLLLEALKRLLGRDVNQKGSNINRERLRLDFNFDRKLTDQEIKQLEDMVNEQIQSGLQITNEVIPLTQAREKGATGVFDSKYEEDVSVYKMGDFSYEICGGPHAKNTADLGKFKIVKEQSSSAGVRRIKAILE